MARFLPYWHDQIVPGRPGRPPRADRGPRQQPARARQAPRRRVRGGDRRAQHPDRDPARLRARRGPAPAAQPLPRRSRGGEARGRGGREPVARARRDAWPSPGGAGSSRSAARSRCSWSSRAAPTRTWGSASRPACRSSTASARSPGLAAPVRVERDAHGVPVVRGGSRADVARATGFLHAQERFFQMDLTRRRAAGELSELFGEAARSRSTVRCACCGCARSAARAVAGPAGGRARAPARLHRGGRGRARGARRRTARVPAAAQRARPVEGRGLAALRARDVPHAAGRAGGNGVGTRPDARPAAARALRLPESSRHGVGRAERRRALPPAGAAGTRRRRSAQGRAARRPLERPGPLPTRGPTGTPRWPTEATTGRSPAATPPTAARCSRTTCTSAWGCRTPGTAPRSCSRRREPSAASRA